MHLGIGQGQSVVGGGFNMAGQETLWSKIAISIDFASSKFYVTDLPTFLPNKGLKKNKIKKKKQKKKTKKFC